MIFIGSNFRIEVRENSTGIRRKVYSTNTFQTYNFKTKKWSDENGKEIANGVRVVRVSENIARLDNLQKQDAGEYNRDPPNENEDKAYDETQFLFVIDGPPKALLK
ncbi:unnamed protein product [Caenorhabditis angaria]|uniref:Uncharacterized protein n=1 Tax=Caenorhabditis angaria TaxID=860376 RepID=A0A9P1IB25_9PELO|nr:unnamed protein product [Caenorhabditis angaria]